MAPKLSSALIWPAAILGCLCKKLMTMQIYTLRKTGDGEYNRVTSETTFGRDGEIVLMEECFEDHY